MSVSFMLAATSLLLVALLVTSARDAQQGNAENYIKRSESEWAAAASKGDTGAVKRILADDFLGIAPDGSSYDKAKEIADTMNDHGNTISNHVNEVKVRFFGETAVAQGSETWEQRNGQLKRGTYVWTDTWVRRNNSWQIVAAEDLLLPESTKK
jgi:ketosteroid isomerase-like protein